MATSTWDDTNGGIATSTRNDINGGITPSIGETGNVDVEIENQLLQLVANIKNCEKMDTILIEENKKLVRDQAKKKEYKK